MHRFLKYFTLFFLIMISFSFIYYLNLEYPAEEIIRKLAGLRLSLQLYKMKYNEFPLEFEKVIKTGYLEDIPEIKLKWKLKYKKIQHYNSFKFKNTGTWAYVNNPYDKNFGIVYIDSTEKDSKGRYWSYF